MIDDIGDGMPEAQIAAYEATARNGNATAADVFALVAEVRRLKLDIEHRDLSAEAHIADLEREIAKLRATAPQVEQFYGATIDGVLRREGDAWTTTDPRHGIIAHTLKIATGAECAPADCVSCARGSCLVEVQECDAWDARVIVHDPGRDDRA